MFVLQTARQEFEKSHREAHGPYISSIIYQAADVQRAFDDATWAGMKALAAPERDGVTGALTAYLQEPCGDNVILLREPFSSAA